MYGCLKLKRKSGFILFLICAVLICLPLSSAVHTVEKTSDALGHSSNGMTEEPGAVRSKTVYLTFDDGPSRNTARILDTLLEYNIRATFFVIGQTDEYSRGLMKRIVEEGHTLAIHSFSHKYKQIYQSVDSYLKDFNRMDSLIYEVTGQHSKIFRFPGGSLNTVASSEKIREQIVREMTDRGYIYYDWNVVSGDDTAKVLPGEKLAENILNGCKEKENIVVLCHDNASRTTTPDAVKIVVERLLDEGYAFDRLTETVKPIQFAQQYKKKT